MNAPIVPTPTSKANPPPKRRRLRIRLCAAALRKLGADPAPPADGVGRWPSTWQGFLWDLAPDELAPDRDGLVAPRLSEPSWLAAASGHEDKLLAAEHERNLTRQADVATTEGKAARLLTPIVALLTGDVTLVAFELNTAVTRRGVDQILPYLGAGLGAVAALYLIVAALRVVDADTRVGLYAGANAEQRAKPGIDGIRAEARGADLASWTAIQKATRVMYARAALSRAVLLITLALALGAATVVTSPHSAASRDKPAGASLPISRSLARR